MNWLIYFIILFPPIIFFTDLTRNPYFFQIFLLNVCVLIFWIIILAKSIRTNKFKFVFSSIDIPMYSFILIGIFTFVYNYFFQTPFNQPSLLNESIKTFNIDFFHSAMALEGIKKLIFSLVNVLMVYWIAANYINPNTNNFNRSMNLLIFTGFIAAGYAILQYMGIEFIWPKTLNPFSGRPVSTFGNPNFLSSYLMMVMPIILGYFILNKDNTYNSTQKIILLITLLTYLGALISTLTRSSWAGLITSFSLVLIYLYKYERQLLVKSKKWIYILLCSFILCFVFWPKSSGGYTTINRLTEIKHSASGVYAPLHQRIMIYTCAFDMVREKPVFGKGWGLFELFYPFYQGKYLFLDTFKVFRTHANNAHNEILEIWSQTGTVGLGIYFWLLVTTFLYGFKLIKIQPSNERKLVVLGILGGIFGMVTDNLLNVSSQFCIPAFLYWWLFGLLVSMDYTKKTYEITLNSTIKTVFACLIILFLYLSLRIFNQFMGEINYFNGFKLSKRNEIAAAIPYLEQSHKLFSEVNSEYELANCYARTGDQNKSLKQYYTALAANFGYDEIYFNLGTVYAQKNDIPNSIKSFSETLSINTLSQEAYMALGNIFLNNLDKYQADGILLLKQATMAYPQNKDLWNNMGYIYTKTKDFENAVTAYRTAVMIDPEFQLARHNLLISLNKLGRKNDPILEYESLIQAVESKIMNKQWKEALPLCKKAVSLVPTSYKARFYLGNIYFTLGDIDTAITEYSGTLKQYPTQIPILLNLGLAYEQKGQIDLAKQQFESVLQIDPNNQPAKQQLQKYQQ